MFLEKNEADHPSAKPAAADGTIKVWDAQTGKLQNTLEGHLAGISAISWSPDSQIIASGSDDKNIRLWDAINVSFFLMKIMLPPLREESSFRNAKTAVSTMTLVGRVSRHAFLFSRLIRS